MSSHGPSFTDYHARLVQPGALEYDSDDKPKSLTDVYAVTLPAGVRPVLSSIADLPGAGSQHETYPFLVRSGLTIRNAVEMSGSLVWMIDVSYEPMSTSVTINVGSGATVEDSVVRIVERAWPVYEVKADLVADAVSGEPVLNSAGEPYDRVPQITRRFVGARVKRLEQLWPEKAMSLDGTVNSIPTYVLGILFPSRTARLEVDVEDTLAVGSETRYVVTYNIVPCHNIYGVDNGHDLDAGWDLPLLECGFYYIHGGGEGEDPVLVRATAPDENGNQTPTPLPVPLDSGGNMLPPGSTPEIKIWQTYKGADWTDLLLPEKPTDYDPEEPEPPEEEI